MAYERPSEIDRQLSAKPRLRDRAVAWATDYGITVEELLERLAGIGIRTSRSAAARWRLRMRPPQPGPIGKLRADVIAKILQLPNDEVRDLARRLGVK